MAEHVKEKPPTRRAAKLPWHVRFLTGRSRKGLPAPAYTVTLERGIRIPMPDGTYQVADRYIPQAGEPCPTLLVRTPYGRGFPYDFMYGSLFAEQGYQVLLQSTRGTGRSGGTCEPFTGEAADAQATVAWLREQPWFNGSLATIGASYLGFTQWALANDPPRELMLTYRLVERTVPFVPGYQRAFGKRVGYLENWLAHPAAGDPYWALRRADPDIGSAPPVHLLGGWYDVVIDQTLDSYRRLREAGRTVRLVVGPWNHTSGFNQAMPIIAGESLAWLRAHTSGSGEAPGPTPVRVHVGEVGGKGQWRDLADWPPPDAVVQSWHLHADGTLTDAPGEGTSSFRYDPADPTPSVGGPRMDGNDFGPKDNGKLEGRDDVLVFSGPVLGEPQVVIGHVNLRLRIRASSANFDVFARLCDVDAGGTSWNICDGLLRLDGTRPTDVDGWTEIEVPMSATAHRFAAGHRLRVQVSGGAHPRWARSTGSAEQIATATTLLPVDIEINHRESLLRLPVSALGQAGPSSSGPVFGEAPAGEAEVSPADVCSNM
jgi:predicted acyl esterase